MAGGSYLLMPSSHRPLAGCKLVDVVLDEQHRMTLL